MKNRFIKFLYLTCLSLGTLSGCKIEVIAPVEKCIVTFNTNGGSTISSQEVVKGDRIQEPEDPIKEGYTFINWTYQGEEWNFIGYTVSEDMTLDANYNINSYYVNLTKNINHAGNVYGEEIYEYGKKVTISVETKPGYTFNGWYEDDKLVSSEETYTFTMPARNVSYEARYTTENYTRIYNKIYFGEYPQTEVKDTSLINKLNALAGTKPTSSNTYNWTDYNYYVNGSISSYMFYQDIDVDSDGTYDYRGVYFTQYRPYYCHYTSSGTYQDSNGYLTNTIYWFSYDPIEWDILKEENGKALIITNLILDSQEYYPSLSSLMFEHNGGNGYANNYELSNIRKFLNDNFYNTAFNELQKEIIETTLVDNSAESTAFNPNKYACNDTNDKMFLLSYKEVTTYYSFSSDRTTKGSDYAKSQGLNFYFSNSISCWWLRSPYDDDGSKANTVNGGGHVSYCGHIDYTDGGVRVACQIIL